MAKEIKRVVKLQLKAGKATPAPPVGTALGPTGINMQAFCMEFNDRTKEMGDMVIPAVITIYDDRSFDFVLKSPPAPNLIKKFIGIASGSKAPHKDKVGTITRKQLEEIVEIKKADLSGNSLEANVRIIAGTARSMGVKVEL